MHRRMHARGNIISDDKNNLMFMSSKLTYSKLLHVISDLTSAQKDISVKYKNFVLLGLD